MKIVFRYLYILIRLGLGIVFLYSGISKMMDPEAFAVLIEAYGLIPESTVYPAAWLLILMEMIAGAGCIIDLQWSLEVITGLMIIFIAILSYGIVLGLDVDCGCFGADEPEYRAFHGLRTALYRDLIMVGGIIYLYIWRYLNSPELISLTKLTNYFNRKGAENEC